jgi:hypothetical protein
MAAAAFRTPWWLEANNDTLTTHFTCTPHSTLMNRPMGKSPPMLPARLTLEMASSTRMPDTPAFGSRH